MKLGQGYVFTGICDSVHRGGLYLTRYTPRDQVHPPGPGTPPRSRYSPPGPGTPARHRACWEIRSTRGRYASYWNAILLHLACSSYFSGLANMSVISLNWDPHLLNCNISSVWQWNLRLYFDRILPFRRFWMRDSLLRVITLNVSGGYTVRSPTCGLRVSLGVNHFLRVVHTVQIATEINFSQIMGCMGFSFLVALRASEHFYLLTYLLR